MATVDFRPIGMQFQLSAANQHLLNNATELGNTVPIIDDTNLYTPGHWTMLNGRQVTINGVVFTVQHQVGNGGFGQVVRVEGPGRRSYILKRQLPRDSGGISRDTIKLWTIKEAMIGYLLYDYSMTTCSSPPVCPKVFYTARGHPRGVTRDRAYYILMEDSGTTLESYLSARPTFLRPILLRLADWLQTLSQNFEYIHCDFKSNNVLIDSNGHPRIIDFGWNQLRTRTGILLRTRDANQYNTWRDLTQMLIYLRWFAPTAFNHPDNYETCRYFLQGKAGVMADTAVATGNAVDRVYFHILPSAIPNPRTVPNQVIAYLQARGVAPHPNAAAPPQVNPFGGAGAGAAAAPPVAPGAPPVAPVAPGAPARPRVAPAWLAAAERQRREDAVIRQAIVKGGAGCGVMAFACNVAAFVGVGAGVAMAPAAGMVVGGGLLAGAVIKYLLDQRLVVPRAGGGRRRHHKTKRRQQHKSKTKRHRGVLKGGRESVRVDQFVLPAEQVNLSKRSLSLPNSQTKALSPDWAAYSADFFASTSAEYLFDYLRFDVFSSMPSDDVKTLLKELTYVDCTEPKQLTQILAFSKETNYEGLLQFLRDSKLDIQAMIEATSAFLEIPLSEFRIVKTSEEVIDSYFMESDRERSLNLLKTICFLNPEHYPGGIQGYMDTYESLSPQLRQELTEKYYNAFRI